MNRRRFLQGAALASLQAATVSEALALPSSSRGLRIIDTHTHFYDPFRPQGVPWPGKEDASLYRRVMPAGYQAMVQPHGVVGTVVVEASPWLEDNQWILDLAAENPFIVGFVGNLAPGDDAFPQHLRRFSRNRLFRGIRIGDDRLRKGLTDTRFIADMKRLRDADLALDVLGNPAILAPVDELAKAVPGLRIVIDHVANVRIDGKIPPLSWREGMRAVGQHANVFCKVSGLVEGTGRRDGSAPEETRFYEPVLDDVYRWFGSHRVIYGSNWPVSEPFAFYATVQTIVHAYFARKGREELERFFSRNAKDAYHWVQR